MSAHTPGAWITDADCGDESVVEKLSGVLVADCAIFGRGLSQSRNQANARLIAAAPDLLSACIALDKDWTGAIPHGPGDPDEPSIFSQVTLEIWRQIRAAIAKARHVGPGII